MSVFLYLKANFTEIWEEISFPSFFRKMLISAFWLRFKVNYPRWNREASQQARKRAEKQVKLLVHLGF